jgi:hypothetical protein
MKAGRAVLGAVLAIAAVAGRLVSSWLLGHAARGGARPGSGATRVDPRQAPRPVAPAVRAWRAVLVALGAAGLLVGAWLLVTTVTPRGLLGLAVWLAAAVVLHDAILSPVLFGVGWMVRLGGRRVPLAALAVVQGAVVVGAIGSLLLLPAIRAKQIRVRNPTVLPFDYVANLAGMWAVLGVLTILGVGLVLILQRRGAAGRALTP